MNISDQYLGCLMLDPMCLTKNQVPVEAIDVDLQKLYTAMCRRIIDGQPIDSINLTMAYRNEDWWPDTIRVSDMPMNAVSKSLVSNYCKQLKEDYKKSQLGDWAMHVKEICKKPSSEAIQELESGLMKLYSEEEVNMYKSISDVADEYLNSEGVVSGISTGDLTLDDAWMLDNGGLHVVAARPAMGKTALSLWLTSRFIAKNYPVLFFSIEMPAFQLMDRLTKIWGGQDSIEDHRNDPLWICDNASCYVEDMMLMATMAKKHKDIRCIIVDHIGKMKTRERGINREQQVAQFSAGLKEIARRLEVPVIAICQLNRSVEGYEDKRPSLSSLRDSGRIEEDADSVVMLYRPEYYMTQKNKVVPEDEKGLVEFIVSKQRNRQVSTLVSHFDVEDMTFKSWAKSMGRAGKKPKIPSYYTPQDYFDKDN